MFQELPNRPDFPQLEESVLEFWKSTGVYEKSLEQSANGFRGAVVDGRMKSRLVILLGIRNHLWVLPAWDKVSRRDAGHMHGRTHRVDIASISAELQQSNHSVAVTAHCCGYQ